MVGCMAVERNSPAMQLPKRSFLPVIRMGVRQEYAVHPIPGGAVDRETLTDQAGSQANV